MSTAYDRFAVGLRHEREVRSALERAGWTTCQFGAGALPERAAKALRDTVSPLRWLPDLIAVRPDRGAVLVDAKASLGGRASAGRNHAIELACAKHQRALFNGPDGPVVPVHYVFDDWLTCDMQTVNAFCRIVPGSTAGSGTPMALVPKDAMVTFGLVFA